MNIPRGVLVSASALALLVWCSLAWCGTPVPPATPGGSPATLPIASAASATDYAEVDSIADASSSREPKRIEVASQLGDDVVRECSGQVLLLDGSPLSDCRIIAVDSTAAHPQSFEDGVMHPGQLASTTTGPGGSFVLRFERGVSLQAEVAFRIFHFARGEIPQLDTVYYLGRSRDIVHRLPASRLVVKTISIDGAPIPEALIWLQPQGGQGRLGKSSKDGQCVFTLKRSTLFDVSAYQDALRVGAASNNQRFDPEQRRDVYLQLLPMDRGQIRVRIVDQNDQPVSRFALRIGWHGELLRHVTDVDLGGSSVVTGLPETEVSVELDRC
ncbi:MAG: hypothetical protein MUC36_18800 [Planctomycetes bacterium]|nr:hypothetical protein [Planctomycetota bacterium]